ncbi:MAG: ribonuclease E [Candidatus Midichloriaceae bacterium]|jgi:ribonuclease E
MSKKIIIDAFYQEETKFLLLDDNNKVEEFEYQNLNKKSIRGNIYLGKVNRVEPSLQAAFVEYGNEKKGFLPFEMIHPRYYQIPVGDKENLLNGLSVDKDKVVEEKEGKEGKEGKEDNEDSNTESETSESETTEPEKYVKPEYKIQEVIKKDQILLIQIDKEERGNKGAFLTTYISLSGRYCVFSPNSIKSACSVSKKIEDAEERDRLKAISDGLIEGNNNVSLILRTASEKKTKVEIKRDFSYLNRIWEKAKKSAMSSHAPALIYEEGDILTSSIKAYYTTEVDEIIVSGDEAFQKVSDFLKIFIPKNMDKLKNHTSLSPVLVEYGVDNAIKELYLAKVPLKSGGYLVINTTEALISIDINSGTYTEEYSIENTALNINIEAVQEIVKQARFRGLSGLIVIDFIDMLEFQNKKLVERELKKAFWYDKAKVQIGRISEFGLLEMSRQRTGRSFIEANSKVCNHCNGAGKITIKSSLAFMLLDKIKHFIAKKQKKSLNVFANSDVVIYLINNHKQELIVLEKDNGININLYIDDLIAPEDHRIIFDKKGSDIENRQYIAPELASIPTIMEEKIDFPQNRREKPKMIPNKKIVRKYNNNNNKKPFNKKDIKPRGAKQTIQPTTSVINKIWKSIVN